MKLTLGIQFRVQKSTFKHKGRFIQYLGPNSTFWTLSSTINTLELFFSYFSTLFHSFHNFSFLFSFSYEISSFLFSLPVHFGTHTQILSPTLVFCTQLLKRNSSKSCFTMLQEQGIGWSYSRLGEDDVG